MTRRQEPKQLTGKVKEKLLTLFAPEPLETLAWQSRFIQRVSSKLSGADVFAWMTTDMLDNPAVSCGGLCDLLAQRHPAAAMTPQALQQRMNTPGAVAYLQDVFPLALRAQLAPLYAQVPAALLASFGRVFLEESTQCCLHEKLAEALKGFGGNASRSTVKSDVIYELLAHQLHTLTITDGRAADPGLATPILASLRAGDLVIRDLGYGSLDALRQIATQDAWCLSRLSSTVAGYTSPEAAAEAVALVDHVQPAVGAHGVGDFAVYLGAARLPCRVLAYRLPEEVVAQRRRQAYETARKKGRIPTHAYLHWLQYGWYMTNVGATVWAAEVVATVYRIRWPIGVSREGHRIQSVEVRPRRTDSGRVAWEAPWRDNKTVEPSDNMLSKEHAQHTRWQRAVNVDVASLHANPVAETVDNARRQQGVSARSPIRQRSPAGSQRRHGVKETVSTGEALGVRRRNLVEERASITVSGKRSGRYQGGGSGRRTGDGRAAKRARRAGPGPVSTPCV